MITTVIFHGVLLNSKLRLKLLPQPINNAQTRPQTTKRPRESQYRHWDYPTATLKPNSFIQSKQQINEAEIIEIVICVEYDLGQTLIKRTRKKT